MHHAYCPISTIILLWDSIDLLNTISYIQSSQNRTPTPSYDKIDQESSSTTSKEDLGQSRATEIENSSSHQKPLSMVPLNSCDNKSHRKMDDEIGATPPTENNFTFNIIYLPRSIPTDSTTRTPPPDNNPLTDTKDKGNAHLQIGDYHIILWHLYHPLLNDTI